MNQKTELEMARAEAAAAASRKAQYHAARSESESGRQRLLAEPQRSREEAEEARLTAKYRGQPEPVVPDRTAELKRLYREVRDYDVLIAMAEEDRAAAAAKVGRIRDEMERDSQRKEYQGAIEHLIAGARLLWRARERRDSIVREAGGSALSICFLPGEPDFGWELRHNSDLECWFRDMRRVLGKEIAPDVPEFRPPQPHPSEVAAARRDAAEGRQPGMPYGHLDQHPVLSR